MYKRVLVTVDGSETAEAILPFILQIAGPLDLDVLLLRVSPAGPPRTVDTHLIAEVYLARLAEEIEGRGVRVRTQVRDGSPVEEILAAVREEAIDLIAMTTRGRTGPSRLLFGSVAEGVLREAGVPLVLMRQTERDIARRGATVRA